MNMSGNLAEYVEREKSADQVEADEAQNCGVGKEVGQKVREARAGQKQFGIEAEFSYLFLPTLSTSVPDSKNCNSEIFHSANCRLSNGTFCLLRCKLRKSICRCGWPSKRIAKYDITVESETVQFRIIRIIGFLKRTEKMHSTRISSVTEIYNLIPVRDRKAMSIEEVEEDFKRRREIVLNQFALRARIRRPGEENDDDESESALWKANNKDQQCKKSSKIDQFSAEATKMKSVKKVHKTETDKRNDHEDGVVMEESDDGDEDGREVDCISSCVELEEKTLVGIDEELTDAFQSVDESEQDDENAENDKHGVINQNSLCKFVVQEQESNSGSEDFDSEDIKSLFLLQCKTDVKPVSSKRKVELDSLAEQKPKKKAKLPNAGTDSDGSKFRIMEEEVRHCFQRHPMSTTDLVAKFKSRCKKMNKQETVSQLANILKKK
ncbi:hypothetical protein T12_8552 [Trichinella patagoniensis]|uniref:Transcription initiation factor IIF subunit alpha n=1 Tax=Trichinella patagoniensis TaxID=990121 RepID=A0A0V1A449_9BILA|nr:hypothetical protein T12_8552 [Trichinella patagoniensis]